MDTGKVTHRGGTNLRLMILGTAIGLLYGFGVRLALRFVPAFPQSPVMTMGFLVFLPFAMGFLTAFFTETKQPQRIRAWLLLPWVSVLAALAATLAAFLEGLICVVMFAPIALWLSTIGGLVGGLTARFLRSRRLRGMSLACLMVLPCLVMPWEKQVLYQEDFRRVETAVDIHAPAAVVWQNIARVPAIRPEELTPSWSQRIGFPDPVEATLSHEGVGGVRNASFSAGILFLETVDVWEPPSRLAFSIRADQVPSTALDEHVRVGGPFFDVLRGEYQLEPLPNGTVRLHLSSQHRVSTDFNWYAHLWTEAVMADLQNRILHVIQQRSERAALVRP
ncbi:MAG TPA: hypothetical protein VN176_14305 [Verrucomicrobiae bacterium]|jgi:hypothetical protein|nr:hypothetical protein [Verrucomicrobiae bacterium]